jgi:hypothetical protein
MQKKKQKITSMITAGVFLTVVGVLIYQEVPEIDAQKAMSQYPSVESYQSNYTDIPENNTTDLEEKQTIISDSIDQPITPSFDSAFAAARAVLGKGHTFIWDGKEYTTDLAEEVQSLEKEPLYADSTLNSPEDFNKTKISQNPSGSQGITVK